MQNKIIKAALETYLPLLGGTLNGELHFNSNSLKQLSNIQSLLVADTFDNGGTMMYAPVDQVKVGSATQADNATTVNGHTVYSNVPSNAKFTDTNTTYSAGTGIGLSGTSFYNAGVRSISTGGSNGTISVNTNGSSSDVAVKGLTSAAYQSNYITAMSLGTTWNYIRFTNNIAICFRRAYQGGKLATAWGSVYTTQTDSIGRVTYPFTFSGPPIECVSIVTGPGTYSGWIMMSDKVNTTTQTGTYEIVRATSSYVDANISYIVIGIVA